MLECLDLGNPDLAPTMRYLGNKGPLRTPAALTAILTDASLEVVLDRRPQLLDMRLLRGADVLKGIRDMLY